MPIFSKNIKVRDIHILNLPCCTYEEVIHKTVEHLNGTEIYFR